MRDVTLPAREAHPYLLWLSDATTEPQHWINDAMARYYQKDSVVVEGEPETSEAPDA